MAEPTQDDYEQAKKNLKAGMSDSKAKKLSLEADRAFGLTGKARLSDREASALSMAADKAFGGSAPRMSDQEANMLSQRADHAFGMQQAPMAAYPPGVGGLQANTAQVAAAMAHPTVVAQQAAQPSMPLQLAPDMPQAPMQFMGNAPMPPRGLSPEEIAAMQAYNAPSYMGSR